MLRLLYCLLLLGLSMSMAHAAQDKRVALVIGNWEYAGNAGLKNPINDAKLVAASLRALQFTVTAPGSDDGVYRNLDQNALRKTFIDFGQAAKSADVVFVYYSGHGMRGPDGKNYLIPVKSNIEKDEYIRLYAVSLDELLNEMGTDKKQLRVVVLDACRNNPFGDKHKGEGTKGLARPPQLAGTLIAFATGEGQIALDGQDNNSPYAAALARHLTQPLDIKEMFDQVAEDVFNATKERQRPMKVDDVLGKHYLAGQPIQPVQIASLKPEPVSVTPQPSQNGGISLEDLAKEEATRQQWAQWQTRMKTDYDKTAAFAGSADLQVKAWDRFLTAWAQDNPMSREDETLRAQAKAARQSKEESVRQVASRQAQEPVAGLEGRFVLGNAGTIRDGKTGLEWSQSDNGSDINWNEATRYCDNKGGGWRLPSTSELQGIFDASLSIPCGMFTCRTSSEFGLTGHWFWTNERNGSSEAFLVSLIDVDRGAIHVKSRSNERALCVRRP